MSAGKAESQLQSSSGALTGSDSQITPVPKRGRIPLVWRRSRSWRGASPSVTMRWALAVFLLAVAAFVFGDVKFAAPARAASGAVTFDVRDRDTAARVGDYRYIVNEDIAHDNASITRPASYSPVVATGDNTSPSVTLPDGKYLLTVLAGHLPDPPDAFTSPYKMWGEHFTVEGSDLTVQVELVPNPLPLSTLRARVFHDNLPVNGEDDIPVEEGLEGFHIVALDPVGEVTVDFFGNPICTEYDGNPSGSTPLGDPVPGTGGFCTTGPDGFAVIPNLPAGKYEVEAVPPDGSGWIQTSTLEGKHEFPGWIEEGATGFSTEEGFLQAVVWFGFVRACEFGNTADDCTSTTADTAGTGSITGHVRAVAIDQEAAQLTLGVTVESPLIALNNLSGDDEQVWMGRGNPDGTFTIPNVPPGLYQLVFWDFPLDYLIQFRTVEVGEGQAVNVGDIGTPSWFGRIRGYAYVDSGLAADGTPLAGGYANGIRDCYDDGSDDDGDGIASEIEPHDVNSCEPGIPGQDLDVRQKDGTIVYATFADSNGYYEFPEYFEWEHFLIWEVGYGRFAQGATAAYETDDFGEPIGYPGTPINLSGSGPAGLLQAQLTWAGLTNWIDTGKLPWGPGENGGIAGIVYYATTRNEFSPRLAAAEDYEPGVPGVTINLYDAALDGSGNPIVCTAVGPGCPVGQGELMRASDAPVASVGTDSWYDNLPTDCREQPSLGRTPSEIFPPNIWADCLELPALLNQVKDGVFDGGYAFDGIPSGDYIVEVVPPAGYRVILEEDQNTDQGDDFVPAVPPPPCAGPLHLVNDPRNPADGTETPTCDSRFVTLVDGFNAPSDFFLMTDNAVPPAGLIRGLLLDDLTLEFNPTSPIYAEKRGIPNAPIGILDFAGNEITRVYSDDTGYWEVFLPSTYTALCPIPSGICPGMYQVVGNYPGTPENPDPAWNPNYGTLRLVFDVWPGRTTYADVAILPITGFVQFPGSQFATPPVCNVPGTTPDIQSVSQPYGSSGDGGAFTINGTAFGASQGAGSVTFDGTPLPAASWSDTAIEVEFVQLSLVSAGPHQLMVTNDGGFASLTGITFHVLGAGYNPPQLHVGPGQTYPTIQGALDAASDGDLILVHPGVYSESLIIDEKVKLQAYGPGVTFIDGQFFNFGGISAEDFLAKVAATPYDGPPVVPAGQAITVLAENGEFDATFNAQIDGFAIRGGSRVRGNVTAPSQGGGIYAHAYARYLEVSNNLVQSNAGNLGGGVILGWPYVANPDAGGAFDNENDFVQIHDNRVLNNGGVSLAGGIALFNGAEGYEIKNNVICGNYSAEYGGGISQFGFSSGSIHDNQVLFNYAFDEGGGVMIGGELPKGADQVSAGSGDVLIARNRIQGNLSNDDGGGIRLLQPVDGAIRIENNMVVNNLATDTGGGISVDDAMNVEIVNNTVAKNISTATAEDADRSTCNPVALGSCPHSAGLVSEPHSAALIAAKGLNCAVDACFSNPVLFNNIFWENEAFYLDGTISIFGGGLPSAGFIDLEVLGGGNFSVTYSDCTAFSADCPDDGTNISADPLFVQEVDTLFAAAAFVGDPTFITVLLQSSPDDPQGDYHIGDGSPVIAAGAAASAASAAPSDDFDTDARPSGAGFEMGADEMPGGAPGDAVGPVTSNVLAAPNPTEGAASVTLTATVDDTTTGNSTVVAAEYFIDVVGADGSGTAMLPADAFDSPMEGVTASVDISALPDGLHTLYVHGRDLVGNWGATSSVELNKTPAPPPTCGGQPVTTFGTAGNDTITGTPGPDVIDGLGGNDRIDGLGGDDIICGGDGHDKVNGGASNDQLFGGAGNDDLKGKNGLDSLFGQDGNDKLDGEQDNDTLDGGPGNDTMVGGAGTDTLTGGDNNDTLKGGDHDDALFGDAGDDKLDGGGGTDSCDGGDGVDTGKKCETLAGIP